MGNNKMQADLRMLCGIFVSAHASVRSCQMLRGIKRSRCCKANRTQTLLQAAHKDKHTCSYFYTVK